MLGRSSRAIMLSLLGFLMMKHVEFFYNISGHRDINIFCIVVPI